ncbi:MAG TPA: hypothetical protein VJ804_15460 [Acidimicrobiales bacterium]|nr:hypothetical protein [Acidimicrobiales bacterium]
MRRPNLYQVRAERSGSWWALTVAEIPGLFSQCRRFREAEGVAREAIALYLDVDPDPERIVPVVTAVLGDVLDKKVRERQALVQTVEELQLELGAASTEVVRDMADLGLTQRDAADVLGISFQRVGQLWPR